MMLEQNLPLERCPHCRIHRPSLAQRSLVHTKAFDATNPRTWAMYVCTNCGGMVMACAKTLGNNAPGPMEGVLPHQDELSEVIPDTARRYLGQARESLHAPDGAVMLAASAVDAMLKGKGFHEGSLYLRINSAAAAHLITPDMALWAHQVRLEANNPRHVDEREPHATPDNAAQAVEFASALANILFVLPSRVTRGLKEAGGTPIAEGGTLPADGATATAARQ
jgi:hypothetical protein